MANNSFKSVEDIRKILDLVRMLDVKSLNSIATTYKNDDDSGVEIGDLIQDDSPGPQDIIERNELKTKLLKYVNELPPREMQIIKLRFGFVDGHAKTLDEIGSMYGVTRERIRQIETKAFKKLRWRIMVKGKCHNVNDF